MPMSKEEILSLVMDGVGIIFYLEQIHMIPIPSIIVVLENLGWDLYFTHRNYLVSIKNYD